MNNMPFNFPNNMIMIPNEVIMDLDKRIKILEEKIEKLEKEKTNNKNNNYPNMYML